VADPASPWGGADVRFGSGAGSLQQVEGFWQAEGLQSVRDLQKVRGPGKTRVFRNGLTLAV